MSERELEQKKAPTANENQPAPAAEHDASSTKFATGGQLPAVADPFGAVAPSASDQAFGAEAFTRGNDVVFGAPEQQDEGDKLIGHELAHVVQQREGRVQANNDMPLANPQGLEAEADAMGQKALKL